MNGSIVLQHLLQGVEDLLLEARHQRDLYGDDARASGLEAAAALVRQRIIEVTKLTLSYTDAAAVSIWVEGTIRNRVWKGQLENIGTQSAGKVRLRDLQLDGSRLFALPPALDEG